MSPAPLRLRACAAIAVRMHIGKVTVSGMEHLQTLNDRDRIVFISTHLTDMDMLVATNVLGKYFNLRIADKSSHHSFWENASVNIALRITGEKFFFPIDYREGRPAQGFFNPKNYIPMARAVEHGIPVLIAAHKPVYVPEFPARGGIGGVYLAGIANARIVPVAIRVHASEELGYTGALVKTIFRRPSADIIIGTPLDFGPLTEREQVSPNIKQELGRRSSVLIGMLAEMLRS